MSVYFHSPSRSRALSSWALSTAVLMAIDGTDDTTNARKRVNTSNNVSKYVIIKAYYCAL